MPFANFQPFEGFKPFESFQSFDSFESFDTFESFESLQPFLATIFNIISFYFKSMLSIEPTKARYLIYNQVLIQSRNRRRTTQLGNHQTVIDKELRNLNIFFSFLRIIYDIYKESCGQMLTNYFKDTGVIKNVSFLFSYVCVCVCVCLL